VDLKIFEPPSRTNDAQKWSQFMKRVINFLYGCKAVADIKIGYRNDSFYNWEVTLSPHINNVPDQIFQRKLIKYINISRINPIESIKYIKLNTSRSAA